MPPGYNSRALRRALNLDVVIVEANALVRQLVRESSQRMSGPSIRYSAFGSHFLFAAASGVSLPVIS
jgi:hypothetical protein